MKIVLLGAPGAGKGSQAELIKKEYGLAHISTGDAFRSNIARGTDIGKIAKAYVEKGMLVPDEIVIEIVKERLTHDDCKNGFILDGFPRTIPQAIALDKIIKLDCVINIKVDNEIVTNRISGRRACRGCTQIYHISTYSKETCDKCGGKLYIREDDKRETVLNRLEVYSKETAPLIDYYKDKNILFDVDGSTSIAHTFEQVKEVISKLKI
ncbi:MAG: adenylate kinase [Christensenellales bacterium]|jgi:adenylate kinase|nr:adenylate kinase [Clostridiales bacterium]